MQPSRLETGWHDVDLVALRSCGNQWRPQRAALSMSVTWGLDPAIVRGRHNGIEALGSSRNPIPAEAFVSLARTPTLGDRAARYRAVGRRPVLAQTSAANAPASASTAAVAVKTANDNAEVPVAKKSRMRGALRDMVFLAALAASLFGAWQSGRMQGVQNVIVVPDKISPDSRLS